MNEEQEKETTEQKPDNSTDGDKPQTPTIIDEANKAAERLEQANKEREELIKREEAIEARRRLGGSVEVPKEEKRPETNKEYVERVMREGYPQ